MLSTLPRWVVPAAIVGWLAIMAIVYFWVNRGDDDEEDEDEQEPLSSTMKMSGSHAAATLEVVETDDMRARKSRMIALKDSLEKSLQTRAGVKTTGLDRLAMPWFMLVGAEGSGKNSLLASTGLPLPFGPPVEVDSARKDAGRWWLFEQAVVVEAPTAKPAPKAVAPSEVTAAEPALLVDTSEGWNNLLHLLRRERPDSPLNGIIVTVSCADLVGTRRKTPEEVTEQAELIRAFLDKTRRVLGVRLPVHLLVTKCDILPGFRSFAETLPDARRDDIFGWANPAPLERPFDPAAADKGFMDLVKSLEGLHDELLAARETIHDADGLFVFVSEFGELEDPLRDFVAKLMPGNERRPSLFFRGIYFTGDASEFAAKAASTPDDDTATLHISIEATEAESHSLVFLRSLFAEKIFLEAGLARSTARVRISRDKRVVISQVAAVLIALLGGAGLWTSLYGFRSGNQMRTPGLAANASDLTRVLAGAAIDMDQLKHRDSSVDTALTRRTSDAAVLSLVNEMRTVRSSSVRSPFIPSSWLSPLPREIKASMAAGLQSIVLPLARERLQERVNRFLGTPKHTGVSDNDLDTADPKSLVLYLGDVRELNRNVARFNSLSTRDSGTVADLSSLVDYLFGERPSDAAPVSPEFAAAVRQAAAPHITITAAQTAAVISRAIRLVTSVTESSAIQLSSQGASSGADDLEALRRLNALSDLLDAKKGLIATVSDSQIVGARLARVVQDSITKYLGIASVRIVKDPLPAAEAEARVRAVLAGLFQLRLMEPSGGHMIESELRPGYKLRWDIGRLDLATSLRAEQRRALALTSDAFAPATQSRLRSALDTQLRSRAIDVAATAQRFVSDSAGLSADIRAGAENLDVASARVVRLARLLDTVHASAEGRKLIDAGARQAENVLAMAQMIVDSARYLAPHPEVVASWRGGIPIGFAAMGVAEEAARDVTLRDQAGLMTSLAADVAPALRYLGQPSVATEVRAHKLVKDWEGITASLVKYAASDYTSSKFALEQYIQSGMGLIDVASCQNAVGRADNAAGAPDFFVARRRMFRASMSGRCATGGGADAANAYANLRSSFTSRLAGHYPFVDSAKAATAASADPSAVREFYAQYDAFARTQEVALRSDPKFRPGGSTAFVFLDQVAQARAFLAPILDSATARHTPEYAVVIEPIRGGSPGDRELRIADRTVALDDSAHAAVWSFGDAVKVITVGDSAAKSSFASTGRWGIVELASMQRAIRVRIYHPDTMVELRLPIFPKVAPELTGRGR